MGLFSTIGSFVGSALAPGWGTAIGSGAGSFIDDSLSEFRSDRNDAASREWQEYMYDKQFTNNTQFWYEQQEYNSPKNQVERLKEAGINPAMAIGNITSGQMGSVGSSSVPGTNISGRMTPQRFNDSLISILGQKESLKSIQLDNNAKEIDLLTQAFRNIVSINNMMADTRNKDSSSFKNVTDAEVANFLAMPKFQEIMSNFIKNITSADLDLANTVMKWKEIEYLPQDKQYQYADALADISLKYEQGKLTKQQLLTEIEKTNGEFYRNENQKFLNSLNKKTEEFILRNYKVDVETKEGTKEATIENAIQQSLPDDYRTPKNVRTMWDLRNRKYGQYPNR